VLPEGSRGRMWLAAAWLTVGLLPTGAGRAQSTEPPPAQAAAPESPPAMPPTLLRVHTEAVERGTQLVLEGSAPLTFDYASPDPQNAEIELQGTLAPSLRQGLAISTPEVEAVQIEGLADPGATPKVRVSVHLTRPLVPRALARGDDIFLTFTALPGERAPDEEEGEEAADEGGAGAEAPASEPLVGATPPGTSATAVGPAVAAATPPAEADREPAAPVEPKAAPAPEVQPTLPAPEIQPTPPAPEIQPTPPAPTDQPSVPKTANEPTPTEPAPDDGPSLADAPAATRLLGIDAAFREGKVAVRLHANGRLSIHDFYVDELPHRLVLDLDGVENHVGGSRVAVDLSPVQAVRVAQYSVSPRLVTRVVVDLSSRTAYRIEEHADGLTAWIDSDEPMPE